MISALALTILATVSPTSPSNAWIKDNEVHVRFYDLTKIYGPFKFYVSASGYPAADCATCPNGVTADYVVAPSLVYQSWPQGGRYAEATFPLWAVGNMEQFYFTAVTCLAWEDRYLGVGAVPTPPTNGKK